MKVLVTGANGFVGKNLVATLNEMENIEVLTYTKDDSLETLEKYCLEADFVAHLAGVNRPKNTEEFYNINNDLVSVMLEYLKTSDKKAPILLSSSIQAELDNDYGKSKKITEDIIKKYGVDNDVKTYILRLPNLFGKWCKPFYNSVVATWSHLIAHNEPIEVSNPDHQLELLYIDDLVSEIIKFIVNDNLVSDYYQMSPTYKVTLGEISKLLYEFKESRNNRYISRMDDDFTRKLYATYITYLSEDDFKYDLIMHKDPRGSFTELIKGDTFGQVSVNVSAPFEVKGEHYHHTKNEKFIVISGKASIKFRNIHSDEVIEYIVSDEKYEVVDIPPGYTHNISNLLDKDLITIMWVNEPFNPNVPDTFVEKVEK